MIYTTTAVKTACNTMLSELFPSTPVYAHTVLEGYERPGFFTQLLGTELQRQGLYTQQYGYSFVITLLEETHDEAYCFGVLDTIRESFGQRVQLSDGHSLMVDTIEWEWTDERSDVLQVTIDFYPVMELSGQTEDGDLMEEADVTYTYLLNGEKYYG